MSEGTYGWFVGKRKILNLNGCGRVEIPEGANAVLLEFLNGNIGVFPIHYIEETGGVLRGLGEIYIPASGNPNKIVNAMDRNFKRINL